MKGFISELSDDENLNVKASRVLGPVRTLLNKTVKNFGASETVNGINLFSANEAPRNRREFSKGGLPDLDSFIYKPPAKDFRGNQIKTKVSMNDADSNGDTTPLDAKRRHKKLKLCAIDSDLDCAVKRHEKSSSNQLVRIEHRNPPGIAESSGVFQDLNVSFKPRNVTMHEEEEDDEGFVASSKQSNKIRRRYKVLDDSSDEDFDPILEKNRCSSREAATTDTRLVEPIRRRNVILSGDDDFLTGVSEEAPCTIDLQNMENEQELEDPIVKTLEKCDQIAASLREELQASTTSVKNLSSDGYSEVNASAAKIVTREDVSAACDILDATKEQILKPYQLVGVNFLFLLHRKNVGGAILADEMGLGKTVQAVVFLALLKHLDRDPGPHLIVAPASVLENWQRELKKWCPSFSVILYHGSERFSLKNELLSAAKSGKGAPFNVILTGYSLFERKSANQRDDRHLLKKWDWSCVVMDEAHLLKDRNSCRTKNLRSIAQNANHRLMMTGTPLQNDLQELWSLLEFMIPDIFQNSNMDLHLGSRNDNVAGSLEDGNLISRIKAILGPFVLRRLKADVMHQLVPKVQKVEILQMLPDQAIAYQESVKQYQVGNHPLLVRRLYRDQDLENIAAKCHAYGIFGYECTLERIKDELATYSDFSLHKLCTSHHGLSGFKMLTEKHSLQSAKCQALFSLLPELFQKGHRPLIFSQWTSMLDILEWVLDVMNINYCRLDGSTQVSERQNIVDNFNNDTEILAFLLSTRAGGQGLNLTGADTVIIHDVDFNPQMDRQAEDRCHRIGQSKPVTIYRLVTQGTVDESIFNIAQKKLHLNVVLEKSEAEVDNVEKDISTKTMGEILSSLLESAP
ncbi:hypothetical protein O6H91_02G141000 [Diphasiastrum complanatum]|uniref:Uncharacterized protein n=1 Tax=Diphasiastrum complanatum TaxID=34168 RepID=A0ACC2ELF7_DIPCM|nr:hypothetical protein O6H91_02G141000 [Diphasiastrum complanatum]